MAERKEDPKTNENVHKVRKHAKIGAKYINDAMGIEEKGDECILPDFKQAKRLYEQGVGELRNAIGIKLEGQGENMKDEEVDRGRKL